MPHLGGHWKNEPRRTSQQVSNYEAARAKLLDDIDAFVKVAQRNRYLIHSLGWNHKAIYPTEDGERRQWSITLMGPEGSFSRENPVPPVVYTRKPSPSRRER